MKKVSVKLSQLSSGSTVNQLVQEVKNKKTAVGLAMMKKYRLTSSSATTVFNLEDRHGYRKTITKLNALIKKRFQKIKPFINYATFDFIRGVDFESGIRISVKTDSINTGLTYTQWRNIGTLQRYDVLKSAHEYEVFERYVKYLSYLAIKNRLAVRINLNSQLQEAIVKQGSEFMEVSPIFNIDFIPSYVINQDFENNPEYTDYEEYLRSTGINQYNPDTWNYLNLGYDAPSKSLSLASQFSPQKLFFYIPHFLQILKAISKKATYVPDAFVIQHSESPQ
jgi:hypothetical protein